MATVGHVQRPHGNRGQVVVQPDTDFAQDRFQAGETLYAWREGRVEPLTVDASRPYDGRWVVGFAGVDSMSAAEGLRGLELKVPAESLRVLDPGSFYLHDLVGCRVETLRGRDVGAVSRVETDTGVAVLVVIGPEGEVLVPFSDAICRRVDPGTKTIAIDPPDGLIDLNQRGSHRR